MRRAFLAGIIAAAGLLGLTAQSTEAATICDGCSYVGPAMYLGAHDASTSDLSTFQHVLADTDNTEFEDFWVFDITPSASGLASADFTQTTAITGFTGSLDTDGGTDCGAANPGEACGAPALGNLIGTDSGQMWEIVFNLVPGRYIIVASGTMETNSVYTGQVSFVPENLPSQFPWRCSGLA